MTEDVPQAVIPQFSDDQVCGMTAATSKLYILAALDEVDTAHRMFGAELRRIRKKYLAELSEPDRFALLRMLGEVTR